MSPFSIIIDIASSGTRSSIATWRLGRCPALAFNIMQLYTDGFQSTILVEPADRILPSPDHNPDQVLRQGPGVEHPHATGHLAPDGLFPKVDDQLRLPLGQLRIAALAGLGLGENGPSSSQTRW
jgi:hypothetical protein